MNAPVTTDTQLDLTAPLTLWRVAGAFMHILYALFGAPEEVAAKHTLRLETYQLIASWLRCGEAMMRRLLLIEAAAFAKPNIRPLLRTRRKRARKLMSFTPDAPQKWRVSFRCFASSPVHGGSVSAQRAMTKGATAYTAPSVAYGDTSPARGGGKRKRLSREERWCAEHRPRPKFRSAWPLAERYEALLRVFNDPLAYARRLARRLHATPHRVRDLFCAPPEAEHRIDQFETLTAAAESNGTYFSSS